MNGKATPRIVIVGAGFGGLNAAISLAGAPVNITVIDKKNYHTFQPLLYQVATAGLSPGEIASPIRSILRHHKNVEVLMADVVGFDLDRRIVKTQGQDGKEKDREEEVGYDYLVVAAGASHAYFGHDEWEPLAPGLKTIEDALEIRRRVLRGRSGYSAEFCRGWGWANRSRAGWYTRGNLPARAGGRFSIHRSAAHTYSPDRRWPARSSCLSGRSLPQRPRTIATAGG
jgi:hypothetical protein